MNNVVIALLVLAGVVTLLIEQHHFKQIDRPVILGECRTDNAKYHRMKLGLKLGYKWVEAVPLSCDTGDCWVIVGHTTRTGRENSANETMGQPQ